MNQPRLLRRDFIGAMGACLMGGASARTQTLATKQAPPRGEYLLPEYACAQSYRSLKQSSYDRTGGNKDYRAIKAGETIEVFNSPGPGVITHIWFTMATWAPYHLKEIVLRLFWDGNRKHEGSKPVEAFYYNIDYQMVSSLPERSLYFHAQYRQATPNHAAQFGSEESKLNLDGKNNYVFIDTKGSGHLMGVTLGVVQNSESWMGEGDEMIFVDNDAQPLITGTGSEDYFCGAWSFGGTLAGTDLATPFAHLYNGAPSISSPERIGGRYCLYRWHADNPVTFRTALRHTIEHGHANDRGDCFYSVGFWYQSEPFTDLPALPDVKERIPNIKLS